MATANGKTKPKPFGKPAQRGQKDGDFEFQLPDKIGSGRGRIPKGKYIGRCVDVIPDTSQSSGNPMWTWTFVITKGEQAGRDFKLWTVLTDDAAWKIVETLKALGQEVDAGDKIKLNKKEVIGVGVTMHIKDDAGKDGDGEFSKLDKISAHPNGAGYKSSGGIGGAKKKKQEDDEDDDRDYPRSFDEGEDDGEDEGAEEAGADDDDEDEGGEEDGGDDPDEEEAPARRRVPVKKSAPAKKPAKKGAPARRR